jgi:hypothetical protein
MIAVTPVAPPPLPDVQVPALQLSAATDLFGDVPGILGGLESAVAADLGSAGSPGSIGGLLDPLAGLVGAASDVSALANVSALPDVSTLVSPADLGTLLTTIGAELEKLLEAVDLDLLYFGPLALPLEVVVVAALLIGMELGIFPPFPVPSATGAATNMLDGLNGIQGVGAASDVSALAHVSALPDVSTLLNPADLGTLLNPGDLSTLLNPADFATLFDPAGISSVLGTLAADIPTMLQSLIP